MNESTSSLLLTDRSHLSITESETATSKHSYNTRLSVKLKSRSSISSLTDVTTTPIGRQLVAKTRKLKVEKEEQLAEPLEEPRKAVVMMRNYPVPGGICDQQDSGIWKRIIRYTIIFFSIGSLVLICSYLGHGLSESRGSVDDVRKELNTFKSDMKDLKGEVQDILTTRDQTNKKLEIIQQILTDMKIQNDKLGPIGKVSSKGGNIGDHAQEYSDNVKTGKADLALESSGGAIVGVKDTETYPAGEPVTFLGVTICTPGYGPSAMIQSGNQPGECWAFKGSKGSAVIKLLGKTRPSGVSLEHIPKAMSPSGEISTAPKEFSILGLEHKDAKSGDTLGTFVYGEDGPPIQEFSMSNVQKSYDYIEFQVHTNHGNPDFTCVYRLRVHGTLDAKRI